MADLPDCELIQRTFRPLRALTASITGRKVGLDSRFIYLGLVEDEFLSGSLSALHVILWKFVLIAFTRVDTDKEEFKPDRVWKLFAFSKSTKNL